jgi:hypothetical protein
MSVGIIFDNGVGLTATAAGNSGDVLTSQGSGSAPIFAPGGGGGGALTAFGAYLSATASGVTGDGTLYPVIYDGIFRNDSSIYDNTTGLLTANKTGIWYLNVNIAYQGILVTNTYGQFFFQTGAGAQWGYTLFNGFNLAESGDQYMTGSALVPLTSGDTIGVFTGFGGNGTPNVDIAGSASPLSSFSGYFVGT